VIDVDWKVILNWILRNTVEDVNGRKWLRLWSNDEFLSSSVKAENFVTRRMNYELSKESPTSIEFVGKLVTCSKFPVSSE
jgi:hypothetical protein